MPGVTGDTTSLGEGKVNSILTCILDHGLRTAEDRWLPSHSCYCSMRPWAQPTDLSFCLYQSLGNFKGKRKSVHDFALKTDAKCPPSQHFKHLISNRRTASFISLKQKAPYSDFMFLGVSQRSENTSPLISIHAANKGIPVLSAQNQDRRGSWGRR